MKVTRYLVLLAMIASAIVLDGCGGRAYVYGSLDPASLRERAESQSDGSVTVSAAVPGRQETEALFGIDLYDQGIQPVWIEIENKGASLVRYALVGTDPYYFSPYEVAYKNRGGLSGEGRSELELRLDALAMPRYVGAGETRSGFVFTHSSSGAKGFNVDAFGSRISYNFTFLLRVPGFVPDYANFNAASIYAADKVVSYEGDQVLEALRQMPCCSTDQTGQEAAEPVNLIVVGSGRELLQALLRSRWVETSAEEAAQDEQQYLFGRPQDAIFKYKSLGGDSLYEIRFWLAPLSCDNKEVWAGQIRHFYSWGGAFPHLDADVDSARDFAIQKFLYGQALRTVGWVSGRKVVPPESLWDRLINTPYFTDGYRAVMWLSEEPFSEAQIKIKDWDKPPEWFQ
jgi:hypothetical protein